jgi:hypothetical protein
MKIEDTELSRTNQFLTLVKGRFPGLIRITVGPPDDCFRLQFGISSSAKGVVHPAGKVVVLRKTDSERDLSFVVKFDVYPYSPFSHGWTDLTIDLHDPSCFDALEALAHDYETMSGKQVTVRKQF